MMGYTELQNNTEKTFHDLPTVQHVLPNLAGSADEVRQTFCKDGRSR